MLKLFQPRAAGIVALYLVVATVWIVGTDLLIAPLVGEQAVIIHLFMEKRILFVLATAFLLYVERARSEMRYQKVLKELKQSEERYRAVVEQSADGISIGDLDGNVLSMNEAGLSIIGYTSEEVIGKNIRQFIVPEDLERRPLQMNQVTPGVSIRFVREIQHKSGSVVLVEINGKLISNDSFVTNFRDVTEQVHHAQELERQVELRTTELQAANLRLQNLDQMKTKFIRDVSHELRHPLANLVLYTHLLQQAPEDKYDYYMQIIHSQVQLLRALVEGILDFSTLDRQPPRIVAVDVNHLIQQILSKYLPHKHVEIVFTPTPALPALWATENKLARIVLHLFQNALVYTPQGKIEIDTLADNAHERIGIQVKDTGIGIPMKDLPFIFDQFYRGANVDIVQASGAGLGLSSVKTLVQQLHGEVEITSTEGEGTTVLVWLPLQAEHFAVTVPETSSPY